MIVKSFCFEPHNISQTSAGLINVTEHELILNNTRVSSNITYLIMKDDFLQIDVCSECFEVGCSNGGYVQVLVSGDLVVWKELLLDGPSKHAIEYDNAEGLKNGTIFWPKRIYQEFVESFSYQCSEMKLPSSPLTSEHALHLWEIYGSKRMEPASYRSYSNSRLEENFLIFYSDQLSKEECEKTYKRAKRELALAKSCTINVLPDNTLKLMVMFDTQENGEWDFVHIQGDRLLFPFGDGYAIEVVN